MQSIVYLSTKGPGTDAGLARAQVVARALGARLDVLVEDGARHGGAVADVLVRVDNLPRGPWASALAASLHDDAALLVKVAASPVEVASPGRTDRQLLRDSPCPVWLLPRSGPACGRVVLAALALDEEDTDSVDRAVLRLAAALACWEQAQLHVVHAWLFVGESIIACPVRGVGPSRAKRAVDRVGAEQKLRLEALIRSEQIAPDVHRTVSKGAAAKVIRDTIAHAGADIRVIGHSRRLGLWGHVIGNLAEAFLGMPGLALLSVRKGSRDPTLPHPLSTPMSSA